MKRNELIELSGQVVNGLLSADDSNVSKLIDRTLHGIIAKEAVGIAHSMLEVIDELTEKEGTLYVVTRCEEHSDYVEKVFNDKEMAEKYCMQFVGNDDAYQREITEAKLNC